MDKPKIIIIIIIIRFNDVIEITCDHVEKMIEQMRGAR